MTKRSAEDDDQQLKLETAEAESELMFDEDVGDDDEDDEDGLVDEDGEGMAVNDGVMDIDGAHVEEEEAQQLEDEEALAEGAGTEEAKLFLPGDDMEDGTALEHDSAAYDMLHSINVEWPCLSFDILRDRLGEQRSRFPMTMYSVAGTTAENAEDNKLLVMKMTELHKTKHDNPDDEDALASDDEDDETGEPSLTHRQLRHKGGVNRVRAQGHHVATFADTGAVHIYDIEKAVQSLDGPVDKQAIKGRPIFSFSGHPIEGFALDWSPTMPGRLLSGDCKKHIYMWEPHEATWSVDKLPFKGHTQSVEDLQWSPTEKNVFASCSADETVRIWDARKKKTSALHVHAHDADVNVISWNKMKSYLLASGGDDGVFKVWDLRQLKGGEPMAQFKWHTATITSIEWHPTDESVIAVASSPADPTTASQGDDQISLWDMSLERDEEAGEAGDEEREVPPQLLFVHQGQEELREIHWHPQIPGAIMSTALSGFNVFKTISV